MADALCGPSNALTSFQKHTTQDRSLQQDRITSHPGQSAGFRSPSNATGVLDAEFEAFQAGVSSPAPAPQPFFPQPLSQNHAPIIAPAPPVMAQPDWAVEFSKLKLQTPSPALSMEAGSGVSASLPPAQSSMMPTASSYNNMYEPSFGFMNSGYGSSMGMGFMGQQQMVPPPTAQHEQSFVYDEAAFARAFDAAESIKKDEAKGAFASEMMSGAVDSAIKEEDLTEHVHPEHMAETIEVFPHQHDPEEIHRQQDASGNVPRDDLAQTASELLDSISHDTSEKFAQSNFLALMRQIRDKEIVVRENDFINSSSNAIANTTGVASELIEEPEALANKHNIGTSDMREAVVFVPPPRPVTPEIDPPAPTFEQWKEKLMGDSKDVDFILR